MSRIRESEPALLDSARALRRSSTPSEQLLWSRLRARGLRGFKFRRQHPLPPFVVDFYCSRAKLAIEIDGDVHARPSERAYDGERDAVLRARGVQVVRFSNVEVIEDLDSVLCEIARALEGARSR